MSEQKDTNEAGSVASELNDELEDVLWRMRDIKDMLCAPAYGCDEWSVPVINLDRAIKRLENIKSSNALDQAPQPEDDLR